MADEEKDLTLKFIEDYKSVPELWERTHTHYTNKVKRKFALKFLATKYNMDINGVKRKIKSLRSYFAKEHQRILKKNVDAECDEIYVSPWFAYKHLSFIADFVISREPRETCTTWTEEVEDVQVETINDESSATSEEERDLTIRIRKKRQMKSPRHEDGDEEAGHEFTPPIIKKRSVKSPEFYDKEQVSNIIEKHSGDINQNDEFTLYGKLIAHKIRNLNSYNRLLAQQRINNVLFDLEMEELNGTSATQNELKPNY